MSELSNNPAHIWRQIQKLGVHEAVNSYSKYERLCALGALTAERFIQKHRPDCFAPITTRLVHRLMFEDVHPWAGNFRSSGEAAVMSGYPAADAWRIDAELDLLYVQLRRWNDFIQEDHLNSSQLHACACAFHHIRFERTHPFRDGNGRVGRLLLIAASNAMTRELFAIDWGTNRRLYFAALSAGNKGNLQPLANLLLEHNGNEIDKEVKSPFRVAPRMFEEKIQTSIEDNLNWSIGT